MVMKTWTTAPRSKSFAPAVRAEPLIADLINFNAGTSIWNHEHSIGGHLRTNQVNHLSNVLQILELLPHLESNATKTDFIRAVPRSAAGRTRNTTCPRKEGREA